jgi:hypothetical protein
MLLVLFIVFVPNGVLGSLLDLRRPGRGRSALPA